LSPTFERNPETALLDWNTLSDNQGANRLIEPPLSLAFPLCFSLETELIDKNVLSIAEHDGALSLFSLARY